MDRALVLDANILIRAVLGPRVRDVIKRYHSSVRFVAPIITLDDAYLYLPGILKKRELPDGPAVAVMNRLPEVIEFVNVDAYSAVEQSARLRLVVWTEDQAFFGTDVANWTTENVEIFLKA